jgi:FtsP/CotA-like multicopper oxidase with cupredoxin domain
MRVDVYNETDSAEGIHWHGQDTALGSDVPAHSMRRMEFTPARSGLSFYHSHVIAAANLDAGLYSGQAGGLLVERDTGPDHYDREWIVVLKDCEPFIRRTRRGCEIGYRSLTVNGRIPGHGTAVRINSGERVLLHVLNASATELRSLALPGHTFEVIALDGNPVPLPSRVHTLQVSPAERVSAIIEAPTDLHAPVDWIVCDPGTESWDCTRFSTVAGAEAGSRLSAGVGSAGGAGSVVEAGLMARAASAAGAGSVVEAGLVARAASAAGAGSVAEAGLVARADSGGTGAPDAVLEMVLTRHDAARSGFNSWSINGTSFSAIEPRPLFRLRGRLRYRLRIRNTSDEILPLHLQRHQLEIVRVAGMATAGILKDVVTVGPHQQLEVDFVADNRGPALFYCTRQLHRDFGLMALIDS